MTPGVRRDGAWARKALTDPAVRSGGRLVSRSRVIAGCGVRTPEARYDARAREIVFPWISGTYGRDLLHREGREPASRGPPTESFLAACLWPLVRLHGMDPAGLRLAPLDPWRRIDPRILVLHADEPREGAGPIHHAALRARLSTQQFLVEIGARPALAEQVVAHGDYHVGQLLFESPTDQPWLLDLDDLALAPRESDLGNFAAHLATIEERAEGAFAAFCGLASRSCPLYEDLVGHRVDRDVVEAHGAIALVRRGLKLHQRGACAASVLDILCAAERLSRGSAVARRTHASLAGASDGVASKKRPPMASIGST